MLTPAPYGSWSSPIRAQDVAREGVRLGAVLADPVRPGVAYWTERRPHEAGRTTVVEMFAGQERRERLGPPWNVRTRAHEYGGGAYTCYDGTLYFAHFGDGLLYRQRAGCEPEPLVAPAPCAYADLIVDARRELLLCVRERQRESAEPEASIVAVELGSNRDGAPSEPSVRRIGADFYSSPRLAPDGCQLAWLSWQHPNMPWDGTELWLADVSPTGELEAPRRVAGGDEESIVQPEWSPDGVLHFASDRSGWWNLYRYEHGETRALAPMEAEIGKPQWVFGMSSYAIPRPDLLVAALTRDSVWRLARLQLPLGRCEELESPFTYFDSLTPGCGRVLGLAAAPDQPPLIFGLDESAATLEVLHRPASAVRRNNGLSVGEPIEFPTTDGDVAYAFYYPPSSAEHCGTSGELPPLLVKSHGGPTAAADNAFDLAVQFWTSRGIAVADVNYRGSTGYGRDYRRRLEGKWGIYDVDDCIAAVEYLARRGAIDPHRVVIRGGSAGGFTTLASLVFRDRFAAGASYFGVGDLEALARDTHKFESRYLDRLIGPYPASAKLYRERSPVFAAERLSSPAIFFQGLEDKVVPPNQAETMVAALRAKGLPVAYVTFAGEGHGFRSAEAIVRSLEAELTFYARILGFEPAEGRAPLEIENL